MNESRAVVIRGNRIEEDGFGQLCFNDLWRATRAKETKAPSKWRLGRMAQALIAGLVAGSDRHDFPTSSPSFLRRLGWLPSRDLLQSLIKPLFADVRF